LGNCTAFILSIGVHVGVERKGMPFHLPPKSLLAAYRQYIPAADDGSTFPQAGIEIDSRYPVAAVWCGILQGVFSVLGRLSSLAHCRDHHTRRYYHDKLTKELGPEKANYGIRTAHVLVWRDWICGSLEDQKTDVLLHLRHLSADMEQLIGLWMQSRPFLAYPPDSVTQQDRRLFASNLMFILDLLQREYCRKQPGIQVEAQKRSSLGVIEHVLHLVHHRYIDSNLSLKLLSADLGISERHIGRQFRELTGKAFRHYLRDLRIREAARLLVHSDCDVKTVAGKVGYSDRSHFCEDFRLFMGCTPLEFRAKHDPSIGTLSQDPDFNPHLSAFSYPKSVFSY
jgi:AraC-like DNA-binding protein